PRSRRRRPPKRKIDAAILVRFALQTIPRDAVKADEGDVGKGRGKTGSLAAMPPKYLLHVQILQLLQDRIRDLRVEPRLDDEVRPPVVVPLHLRLRELPPKRDRLARQAYDLRLDPVQHQKRLNYPTRSGVRDQIARPDRNAVLVRRVRL